MFAVDLKKPFFNLRVQVGELVLKSIIYNVAPATDVAEIVQIWCNKTLDGLIGSFPNNGAISNSHNEQFKLNSSFQTGNIIFQFQEANGVIPYYNPGLNHRC